MTLNDKKEIKDYLEREIQNKIKTLKTQINDLAIDAQNDAKGSAGDKHETSLAMMHLEQEKLSIKLEQTIKQLQIIQSITTDIPHQVIALGSLVDVGTVIFFVSDALPHFILNNKTIFPLSTKAPIYEQLKGKQIGETLRFNNKEIQIKRIV